MGKLQIIDEEERFEVPFEESVLICRRLSRRMMREIEARHTKMRWRPGGVQAPEVEQPKVEEDWIDHCIVGWRGVVGRDGEDVPCERAYKLLLPPAVLNRVISRCLLGTSLKEEAPLGNSEGGSGSA
jgi:hypothetical protein